MRRALGCAFSVCLLALISFNTFAETAGIPADAAQGVAVVRLEDGSVLAFSMDRSVPIVTWEHWPEELRAGVPAETIEIFADGTVRVTYPGFRRFAGVYEQRLSSGEFNQLLAGIAISGLASGDGRELKRAIAEREPRDMPGPDGDAGTASFDYRTSETVTVVRTRVHVLPRQDTTIAVDDPAPNVFRYRGLETDAARHPDHAQLKLVATVRGELLSIAKKLVEEAEATP